MAAVAWIWVSHANAADTTVIALVQNEDASAREVETLDAIRNQVGDLPVVVVVARHARFPDLRAEMDFAATLASERDARGVFWVDTDVTGDALLFMLDPDGKRLLLRRIQHANEAVTEEVANVAHSIVAAIAEGRRVGMTPLPVPAKPPPPVIVTRVTPTVRVPASTTHAALVLDWSFAGETLGPTAPWVSGLDLGIEGRLASGFLVRAEYIFTVPTTIDDGGIVLRLAQHPFAMGVGWITPVGPFVVGGVLLATLDGVGRTTLAVPGNFQRRTDAVAWNFAVSPRLRAEWNVTPWLALHARMGTDIYLEQAQYAASSTVVFAPFPVRFRVDAGATIRLF